MIYGAKIAYNFELSNFLAGKIKYFTQRALKMSILFCFSVFYFRISKI